MVIQNYYKTIALSLGMMLGFTTVLGMVLASSQVMAEDNSVVDEINITVPVSCTMSGTGMDSHNAEIENGLYKDKIGTTTLHAFCNDNEGFAIYAAGYTGNEIGGTNSNKLVGTNASSNATIASGTATSAGNPDISNWAMKLAISQDSGDTTSTNAFTIDSAPNVAIPSEAEQGATSASFSNYHVVPNEYVKVAHKNSMTDMTATTGGVKLTTTYAAYISKTQPADTYTGQVIYTLVHPSTTDAPVHPDQIGVRYHADSTYQFANHEAKNLVAYKETCGPDGTNTVENSSCSYIADNGTYTDTTPISMWYALDNNNKKIYFDNESAVLAYLAQNNNNLLSTTIDVYATTVARLDTDKNVNVKLKSLAAGTTKSYYNDDTLIKAIRMSDTLPENFTPSDENTISLATSRYPVYIWFDNTNDAGIIYVYTEAKEILMNLNSSFMFDYFTALTDLSGLASWDTSNVINMGYMFQGATSLTDLSPLASWDTSSVTNMGGMFHGTTSLTDLSPLASWDTGSVTDMSYMFYGTTSLTDLSGLANWDTGSVTTMGNMFRNATSLTNLSGLASWNTSSVTYMGDMFSNATSLTDLSGLNNWNTSSVTNMSYMFYGAKSLTDLSGLASWDTSSVTYMGNMFGNAISLTNLSGLASWDTSSVMNMSSMFQNATSLTQAGVDAINTWDITNVGNGNFKFMFRYVPYHPTFTKRQGTWDSSGTFTPSS